MSIEAMSWAFKLEIARSSEKFVMVCLANYADERGTCYPSVQTICLDTGLDRKTVISSLKHLRENGLLRDTGQRIGRTSAVPVYQLIGIPSASTVHYVYRVTNRETGEFYIGVRSFNGDPELDVYRGRSKWIMDMLSKDVPLYREVLDVFDNEPQAKAAELRRFKAFSNNPLCRNEHAPRGAPRGMILNVDDIEEAPHSSSNNAVPSCAAFSVSSTVIPESSTVIPSQQYQKRDTEPSKETSEESSDKTTKKKATKKSNTAPAKPVVVDLPDWLPTSAWQDWVDHRALTAPLTQRSAELCIGKLAKMREDGHDPVALIERSVLNGKWTDFYPPRQQPFNPMKSTAFDDLGRPAKFNAAEYVNSGVAYAQPRPAKFDPSTFVNSGAAYANGTTRFGAVDPFTIDANFVERH